MGKPENSRLRGRVRTVPAVSRFSVPEHAPAGRLTPGRVQVSRVVRPPAPAGNAVAAPEIRRAKTPERYSASTGIKDIDLVRADVAESLRRIRDARARAGQIRDFVDMGLSELAAAKGVRLKPEELAAPEVIERLPSGVRGIVDKFVAEIDAADVDGPYRTTRPIGRNIGRMI